MIYFILVLLLLGVGFHGLLLHQAIKQAIKGPGYKILKIHKSHFKAVTPAYAYAGDAAMDLTAIDDGVWQQNGRYVEYSTGLAFEIPKGYVGLVFPRSSISNYDLDLCNSTAVIDSNYRGLIKCRFRSTAPDGASPYKYKAGDRIGQLMILPRPEVLCVEAEALEEDPVRGELGFGSSGQ